MAKKSLLKQSLIEAKELEMASMDNAKKVILESFNPDFVSFFKDVLNENEEVEDEEMEDEELEEGNEHDMGKFPDPGREGTDPALDDDEEQGKEYQVSEGEYGDVKGDPTPEKGQAGLPNKPTVKTVGDDGWEDEGSSGEGMPSSRESQKGTPATKQVGDGGWEDEGYAGAGSPTSREALAGTPSAKVVTEEEDSDELDVPEGLFDDEESDVDMESSDEEDDGVDLKVDDNDEDDLDEEIDIDIEDDEESETPEPDEEISDEEEIEEGLYVREGREFRKVTPAEYLQNQITTLKKKVANRDEVIETLQNQLHETNLFNAKFAHLNKLYMSGSFTRTEKERIAERLDECTDISEVQSCYKSIVNEVNNRNPLDGFSSMINEQIEKRNSKVENVYESSDVARMKRLINYDPSK